MINILFIAFEFPPLNRGGVHRPLAFVKYLPQFGINPIVITLDQQSYQETFDTYAQDPALGAGIAGNSTIVPVKTAPQGKTSRLDAFFSIYFSIHGNETRYWKGNFLKAIPQIIAQYEPKAILATVPPFSILPLAVRVAKEYGLPLALDFRDAWSQWRTVPYGTIFHYLKTLSLEKKYLRTADAVIVTSRQTMEDFKKLHKEVQPGKFHYIPNGYNGSLLPWQPIDTSKEILTIGYVGSFYYSPQAREQMLQPWWKKRGHRMLQYIPHKQDWLYRSPFFFFMALRQLNRDYPAVARKIRVKFAGKKPAWLQAMIASFELEGQVELIGELPHRDSLLFQQQCDALLITSAKQFGGRDYSIAGKTFEYLQMQRPVIAFVCEGSQKDILAEAGTALICNPDDTEGSVEKMNGLFTGQIVPAPSLPFLAALSREALTANLSGIIKKIIT